MELTYEKTQPVTAREADNHRLCRPSALLERLQDLATDHAAHLGVGWEVMERQYGAFWMLVRLEVRLTKPLGYEDEVTVRTWHRGAKSATVFRDFDILIGGEAVGEAVTSWVIADRRDRRLIRPTTVPEIEGTALVTRTTRPEKVAFPEDAERWGHRRVRYSDADLNGHMNNVRYADVACDAIGYEEMGGKFVSHMSINYLHECFPGEDILVLCGEREGRHFVRGTDEAGVNRFDVALTLSDIQ